MVGVEGMEELEIDEDELLRPVRRRAPYYVRCADCRAEVSADRKRDVRMRAWMRRWDFCRRRQEWLCRNCLRRCALCPQGCPFQEALNQAGV